MFNAQCSMLTKFYFVDILFLLAVVTSQNAVLNVEVGLHRLIVGNTLGVITLHPALNLRWCNPTALLNHLVVAYNAQYHDRCNYREA